MISLQGQEIIGEASELTKSASNVLVGGSGSVASDFTKHLLAYEDRRQQLQKPVIPNYQANINFMPFEIAES